jgi:hypothetical protein
MILQPRFPFAMLIHLSKPPWPEIAETLMPTLGTMPMIGQSMGKFEVYAMCFNTAFLKSRVTS